MPNSRNKLLCRSLFLLLYYSLGLFKKYCRATINSIKFILIISLCSGLNSGAVESIPSNVKSDSTLILETKNGIINRSITNTTTYSYEYKNKSNQKIELIYGSIPINHSSQQYLSNQERLKIQDFNILKVGNSLMFSYTGNSGAGSWTRNAKINVISVEDIYFKGMVFPTVLIAGNSSAPGFYDFKFKCWYSTQLKSCLKSENETYITRNPSANGTEIINLIDFIQP